MNDVKRQTIVAMSLSAVAIATIVYTAAIAICSLAVDQEGFQFAERVLRFSASLVEKEIRSFPGVVGFLVYVLNACLWGCVVVLPVILTYCVFVFRRKRR